MSIWLIVAVLVGGTAVVVGVARARGRRAGSQEPQNIYPVW